MRRTARAAIHRTNAVRSGNPRIASGREAGAAAVVFQLANGVEPTASAEALAIWFRQRSRAAADEPRSYLRSVTFAPIHRGRLP